MICDILYYILYNILYYYNKNIMQSLSDKEISLEHFLDLLVQKYEKLKIRDFHSSRINFFKIFVVNTDEETIHKIIGKILLYKNAIDLFDVFIYSKIETNQMNTSKKSIPRNIKFLEDRNYISELPQLIDNTRCKFIIISNGDEFIYDIIDLYAVDDYYIY